MDANLESKYGLRITPAVVEFTQSNEREVVVTVRNISVNSIVLRLHPPSNQIFKMKVKSTDLILAPGLSTQITLIYAKQNIDIYEEDRFVVASENGYIEVRLIASPPKCVLSVSKQVDFGCLIADNRVVSRNIKVTNEGDKQGEYKVKYLGSHSVTIHPKQGIVPPNSSQIIKINLCATAPGRINEFLSVILEKSGPKNVMLVANVVEQRLELLHSETSEPIEKVQFGNCYYGCDLMQMAILYNHGPTPVKFVAVMEEDTVGQETDGNLTEPASIALVYKLEKKQGRSNALTNLITIQPNEGTLAPNEKILVTFLFTPRWEIPEKGWKFKKEPPLRRDFAIFIQFQVVGMNIYTNEENHSGQHESSHNADAEVAITGTALPVLLSLSPNHDRIDFGTCEIGKHVDVTYHLINHSTLLPVNYQLKRKAHFKAVPEKGSLEASKEEQITFSFIPKQTGEFNSKIIFEVFEKIVLKEKICPWKEKENPQSIDYHSLAKKKVIFAKEIELYGIGKLNPTVQPPKFNTGITPYITNEVGLRTSIDFSQIQKVPLKSLVSSSASKLIRLGRKTRSAESQRSLIAVPNDRAQSIRPSKQKTDYRNLFTKEKRYTYTDPDYMHTDKEAEELKRNRDNYKIMVSDITKKKLARIEKKNFDLTNNDTDLGLTRAAGLKPKTLKINEFSKAVKGGHSSSIECKKKLLSTKDLAQNEEDSEMMAISHGLNAIPTTQKEKEDCAKELSPSELHLLNIGPPKIDFGKVCRKSRNTKNLVVANNLAINIYIVTEMGCAELSRSSPLSQVIPPHCKGLIPIVFESDINGKFSKSITYTINGYYENHICVLAEVVPVALELGTPSPLIITPVPGLPPESAFSSVVTLCNKLNYPAAFSWTCLLEDNNQPFTIRPMQGVIEEYQELDCEVLWTPGYFSVDSCFFTSEVLGGNTIEFECKAQLGSTNIHFLERRLAMINCPVNLTTIGTTTLVNTGSNHAYFQVVDVNPVAGMTITPMSGIIPIGGEKELQLFFIPTSIMKFDFNLEVAIRNWRNLILRVGGSVENPCIAINVPTFTFGGVCCGSAASIDFTITNKTSALSRVDFDLTSYGDFTFSFDNHQTEEEYRFQSANPGMYSLTLKGHQAMEGKMFFHPTELAAYDFIMPVYINHVSAPAPFTIPSPTLSSNSSSKSGQHNPTPNGPSSNIITPRKRVIATGLRSVIEISKYAIHFVFSDVQDGRHTPHSKGMFKYEDITIVNRTDEKIRWDLDITIQSPALEQGIIYFENEKGEPLQNSKHGYAGSVIPKNGSKVFRVVCEPKGCGNYECQIPLYIRGDYDNPYKYIFISVHMKSPRIKFKPSVIHITVPLLIENVSTVELEAINYSSQPSFIIKCPKVECEDGNIVSPITVNFQKNTDGQETERNEPKHFTCNVTFYSEKPLSFRESIVFIDQNKNRFKLCVVATADNCLLTCYSFLASHQQDYNIVCAQGTTLKGQKLSSDDSTEIGEAVCVPFQVALSCHSETSTCSTTSNFQMNSSNVYESATPSDKPSDSGFGEERDRNESSSSSTSQSKSSMAYSFNSYIFPEYDKAVGPYFQNILNTVQRWFTANGSSSGATPVLIPHTFRSSIGVREGEKLQRAQNSKREPMSIYHCIKYLTGKNLPGINGVPTIPNYPVDRVNQIYSQHNLLLTFLKSQGACVASIKSEYLMEFSDFHLWKKLGIKETAGQDICHSGLSDECLLDKEVFELVSKRAWLDTLLQIIKCLILSKVTIRALKRTSMADKTFKVPTINTYPHCSNIYSTAERIILAWLNRHYEFFREKIWTGNNGVVPAARWVVNFDHDLNDGLVLGTLIGAYLPFLVQTHIIKMITFPVTHEHYFHNSLKIICALRFVGIDYDIQAMDITDPNPIHMLLFCVHLFQVLPQYIPKNTIEFVGDLTETITKQVKLSNPSPKPLSYTVAIIGDDADNFNLPKGNNITIQPKHSLQLTIIYHNVFLRPNFATLILTGTRVGSGLGANIAFTLLTRTVNIIPQYVQTGETPCYELLKIPLDVLSPFSSNGEFSLCIVEDLINFNAKRKMNAKRSPRYSVSKTGVEVDQEQHKNFFVKSFHCRLQNVFCEANKKQIVDILFLPFSIGFVQCSVIFSNTELGDFVYEIRATSIKPLPLSLPSSKKNHTNSSMSESAIKNSSESKQNNAVYWRCEVGQTLRQSLWIPIINAAKEEAILKVARLQMSDLEYKRRSLTGTLDSSARAAEAFSHLMTDPVDLKKNQLSYQDFLIEHDSKHFSAPKSIRIPFCLEHKDGGTTPDISKECVELPLVFFGEQPGHFDVQILLKSPLDIRVYKVECTALPESGPTYIEFETPVLQKCTQNIPIANPTNHDWNLKVEVIGEPFTGLSEHFVPAKSSADYAITYQPTMEDDAEGKLIFSSGGENDQMFYLWGLATEPLALGEITIDSEVRGKTTRLLKVPNPTKKRLMYEVHSNLPFLSGLDHISVSSGQVGHYQLDVVPIKCGTFEGVISFVAGKSVFREVDSDGDEAYGSDEGCKEYYGYRVWYILIVNVKAGPPVGVINIKCPCQKTTLIDVNVTNPTSHDLTLEVTINGQDLHGPDSLFLKAGAKDVYKLTFAPSIILKKFGSLRFFHEYIGEFWYELNLKSEHPAPVELPTMECRLGLSVSQGIVLTNNSDEAWEMFPIITDKSFHLSDYPEETWPIVIEPNSCLTVKLTFAPSTLAQKEPRCDVIFACKQQGRITYFVKGCVLLPSKNPPTVFYSVTGQTNSGIVKFYNPLDEIVYVNLKLKDGEHDKDDRHTQKVFIIHLTQRDSIVLSPHQTLDIPVAFSPLDRKTCYAECVVSVHQTNTSLQPADGNLPSIDWCFPLIGIPEYVPVSQMPTCSLTCKMRKKLKAQIQISINLDIESTENTTSATVLDPEDAVKSDVFISSSSDISFELQFPNQQAEFDLESIVKVQLVKKKKEPFSSDMTLNFNIEFFPKKCLEQYGHLVIFKQDGCLWRFPILFASGDPDIDDIITIEAKAMYKMVTVFFFLKPPKELMSVSKLDLIRNPEKFSDADKKALKKAGEVATKNVTNNPLARTASYLKFVTKLTPNSDPEITVSPHEGEFDITRSRGNRINVHYNPTAYGQKKSAVLYIQTDRIQWTYSIEATLPKYHPPIGKSSYAKALLEPAPRKVELTNFISNNRHITVTGVSSPYKGAPIVKKLFERKPIEKK